jgi:amino acid transporter
MAGQGRFAALVAVFAAALFIALAICVSGFVSLYGGSPVIVEHGTGPLLVPLMFAAATAVVFALIGVTGAKASGRIVLPAIGIGLSAYLAFLLFGAVIYTFERGRVLLGLLFVASNAVSPYAITVGVVAILVAFGAVVLLVVRSAGGAEDAPHWPWEMRPPD